MIYALNEISPLLGEGAWVAPSASVIGNVIMDDNSSVWFGAVARGDTDRISIGPGANVQDNSVLHCDPGAPLTLAKNVTVGHQVMLHGCSIGENSLIGIGSTILNHAIIGANCLVGANSLITENKKFPDGVLIMGSPAKVIRELTPEEIAALPISAERYVANAARYRRELRAVGDEKLAD